MEVIDLLELDIEEIGSGAPEEEKVSAYLIGHNLRKLMIREMVSTKDLAKVCNVKARTVRYWLAGERAPNYAHLRQMCGYFGVLPHVFFKRVEKDWENFTGSTLDACRVAMLGHKMAGPVTGVLYDYLTIGTFVPEAYAESFYNALMTQKIGCERLHIDQGKIFADGKKVGHLVKSQGRTVNENKKFQWNFTGHWFRPLEMGGANFTAQNAFDFVMDTCVQLQGLAWTKLGEVEHDGQTTHKYKNERQNFASLREEMQRLAHEDVFGAHNLVNRGLRVFNALDELKTRLFGKGYLPVTWAHLKEFPLVNYLFDRVDWCVEILLNQPENGRQITAFDFLTSELPEGWHWRETRSSTDGHTIYAGTTEKPTVTRGEKPMFAVYTKTDRPQYLRCEFRCPRVTYHRAKEEYGIRKASETAASVFSAFLPYVVGVDKLNRHYGDKENLGVPIIDVGPKPCVHQISTKKLKPRPFTGHDAREIKRLINQGITMCIKFMSEQILAIMMVSKLPIPPEVEGGEDPISVPVSVNGSAVFIPGEILREAGQLGEREPYESPLDTQVHSKLTAAELMPLNFVEPEKLRELAGVIDTYMSVCHKDEALPFEEPFQLRAEVKDKYLERLTQEPHISEWASKPVRAGVIEMNMYQNLNDSNPAEPILVSLETGLPLSQPF